MIQLATSHLDILDWMTALADATRARMLRLLSRHEMTVAELCMVMQLPQSTVSRHLKILNGEGWAAARREGTSSIWRCTLDELDAPAGRLWNVLLEQLNATRFATQDDQRLQQVLARRQSRSQAFFASSAGQWDKMREELFGSRFDLLALAGLLDPDWVVGDLGCGAGQVARSLAPFVQRVVAVDESEAMLQTARQRLADLTNVTLKRGDLTDLPLETACLDAAVVMLVLHHVPEPPAVLRQCARALKPGGRLLLVDMLRHDRIEYQQTMGHVWLGFEPTQMTDWLRDAGFEKTRFTLLPAEPQAKGPTLFAAAASRTG